MTQQVNPLADFMQNTLSVQDLLNIYNKYAPQPLTIQEVQRYSNGDVNVAKTELIARFLAAARDGQLFGGFSNNKVGMKELQHIILDLQRDIKRVKNAISPQGAEDLITKHNAANPSSPWKLNKRNPNAPASLQNLTDINNDGIPDVVISNRKGEPMFVNGYTTKASNYPETLAYYNKYPTREDRHNHSFNDFRKQLYNVTYDDENSNVSLRGNVSSFNNNPVEFAGYDLTKYNVKPPKRMSSYNRFRKYVAGPFIDGALQICEVPKKLRLQVSAKAIADFWNTTVLQPLYTKYGVTNEKSAAKIKKSRAGEIDQTVDDMIFRLNYTNDQWSEDQKTALTHDVTTTLTQLVERAHQNALMNNPAYQREGGEFMIPNALAPPQ